MLPRSKIGIPDFIVVVLPPIRRIVRNLKLKFEQLSLRHTGVRDDLVKVGKRWRHHSQVPSVRQNRIERIVGDQGALAVGFRHSDTISRVHGDARDAHQIICVEVGERYHSRLSVVGDACCKQGQASERDGAKAVLSEADTFHFSLPCWMDAIEVAESIFRCSLRAKDLRETCGLEQKTSRSFPALLLWEGRKRAR